MDTSGLRDKLPQASEKVFETVSIDLPGGLVFQPSYLQAGVIVLLLFLLVLTLGSLRHRMNHWTIKGVFPGIAFGFLLAIILEGFLLVGGKTFLIGMLGWKEAPGPVTSVLDVGREKLVNVLGTEAQSAEELVSAYEKLSDSEAESVRLFVCTE